MALPVVLLTRSVERSSAAASKWVQEVASEAVTKAGLSVAMPVLE
jgi:hypothetical protein